MTTDQELKILEQAENTLRAKVRFLLRGRAAIELAMIYKDLPLNHKKQKHHAEIMQKCANRMQLRYQNLIMKLTK